MPFGKQPKLRNTRTSSQRANTTPRSKQGSVRGMVLDHYVVFWPVQTYLEAIGATATDVAHKLGIQDSTMRTWVSRGYTPLRVYKAMAMVFRDVVDLFPTWDEKTFVCEEVEKTPFRLSRLVIEPQRKEWDRTHPRHPWHWTRLRTIPKHQGPLTYGGRHPEPTTAVPTPRDASPATVSVPYTPTIHESPRQNVPSRAVPPAEQLAEMSWDLHAGMRSLAELARSLKQQRDQARDQGASMERSLKQELAEYRQMIADRDRTITDLTNELDEAKAMLDEALAAMPATPSLTPEEQAAAQESEAKAVLAEADPDLLAELEALNHP